MTKSVICALSAALVVPALVQPAMAADSKAQTFLKSALELNTAVAVIYDAIDTEEATPDEAGEALALVVAGMQELMAEMGKMTPAEQEELAAIMSDADVAAGLAELDEINEKLMNNLKAADYLGSDSLKAACEAFTALGN